MTDLDKQSATPLRAACIHGRYEMHGTEPTVTPLPDGRFEASNLCNGGRVVTIDYEAAAQVLSGLIFQSADNVSPGEFDDYADKEARRIVAAAIRDTDG